MGKSAKAVILRTLRSGLCRVLREALFIAGTIFADNTAASACEQSAHFCVNLFSVILIITRGHFSPTDTVSHVIQSSNLL